MDIDPFAPAHLGSIALPNRILRSATHEGLADDHGAPTARLTTRYLQLARGGVGAIFTGYAGVAQEGKSSGHQMLMMNRAVPVEPYRALVSAVHDHGTPIIAQIAHCGRQTREVSTGAQPVAPSALRDALFNETVPRELTAHEIHGVIEAFVSAIERAKAAGFDGVQLHAAHGYLLSSFLSSYTNRRRDEWGGSLENRFRIVAEILTLARRRVGPFPILAKINGHDARPGGMRPAEAVEISRLLERSGCAAVEVSCGTFEDGFHTIRGKSVPVDAALEYLFRFQKLPRWARPIVRPFARLTQRPIEPIEAYNVPAAEAVKQAVAIPVIVVGGIRSVDQMRSILSTGQADFIAMSRPFIREPGLVRNLREGRQTQAGCTSCGVCAMAMEREPLRCHDGKVRPVHTRIRSRPGPT